jgi:hypothetical protein
VIETHVFIALRFLTVRTSLCSNRRTLLVLPTSKTCSGIRSIRKVTAEDRTLSEAPRRHAQSWFYHYPREARRRDRRHSLRSQDAPSARAVTRSKEFYPRRGASIIIALAGERSLNRTPQKQRHPNGKEPRSAQTRTAPHIVAERTASHEEARLRHHGFSTSLRLAPRTPRTSAPMRFARYAPFRTPSCLRLASFYLVTVTAPRKRGLRQGAAKTARFAIGGRTSTARQGTPSCG